MRKKLLPVLLTFALAIALLTVGALAAAEEPGPVAQIGENTYDTLDEAIYYAVGHESGENVTITILSNCNIGERISIPAQKNVTITAADGTDYTITDNGRYGITIDSDIGNSSLTFENVSFVTNGQIYIYDNANLQLEGASLSMDGEMYQFNATGYYCSAISMEKRSASLTFDNSDVHIEDYPSQGSAIRWDDSIGTPDGYSISIINGTTFESTGCYAGFTGTCNVLIENSEVNVYNHRGNGGNGSNFIIKSDAELTPDDEEYTVVNFYDNGSHGLSAGTLEIDNATVIATGNGANGVHTNNVLTIKNNAVVTISENDCSVSSQWTIPGAMHLGSGNSTIDGTSTVTITNNDGAGLFLKEDSLTIAEGANITITNNTTNLNNTDVDGSGALNAANGGGINNRGTIVLPSDAVIYNNHATDAGDDIYCTDGASLTFGTVGTDWYLDGAPDCSHLIDVWYDDSADARWEAHADTDEGNHVQEHEVSDGAVTGTLALKAAHGLLDADVDTVTITPADIIVYTGGDSYEGSINDEEQIEAGNGLPTPGYFITLPDWVDEKYFEGSGTAADLTGRVRFVLDSDDDGLLTTEDEGDRIWELDWYTDENIGSSTSIGGVQRFVYRMDADSLHNIPVRIQFTDEEGNTVISDDYTINLNDLYKTYRMTIYPGELNRESIKAQILDDDGTVLETLDVKVSENATLTIRGTTNAEIITGVGSGESDVAANTDVVNNDGGGAVTAIAPSGTEYYINESLVAVDPENVSLITDAVVETEPLRDYIVENDLAGRGENYVYRYLDLVDDTNGRAWVMATEDIEVYWSLPEGSSPTDNFRVIHFQGLDRQYDDLDAALAGNDPVIYSSADNNLSVVEIDGEYYLRFAVDTFSPRVLVWDTDGGDEPVIPPVRPTDPVRPQEPDGLNTEDHVAYIIGYPDGEVKPEGNITRAEVATIFFRLLTDETREEYWSQTNGYTDVARDAWYNNAISTLSNIGIIDGYEDGSFRPNSPITRAEFTKIAVSFFEYADIEYEGTFSDVAEGRWYTQFVAAAVEMGLIEGYPDGTFRPDASITRAEACTIVNRTLGRAPHEDHLLPEEEMITWPDNLYGAWYYADMQEATNSHDYEWTTEDSERVEDWTEKLPERDWDALEEIWSEANDAPGGEVIG